MEQIRNETTVTVTAKEAAQYIGISYWLLLDMAKRSQIPCIRCGDRVLFRKETLDLWMQNQETKSVQPERSSESGVIRKIKA